MRGTDHEKIEWLVALEEIRRVIAIYAQAGDDNNNPDTLATILLPDAIWEAEGFGRYEGREEICRALADIGREQIVWSLHFPVSPVIDINDDGRSAAADWWLWEIMTMRGEDATDQHLWLGAKYACDFVRVADGWKIKHLRLDIQKMVPYEEPNPPLL